MENKEELSACIVQIGRNYANVSVSGRPGIARLDISSARKIVGANIADLREILENNERLIVRVIPMSDGALSKIPALHARQEVKMKCQWEVKFFKKDIEPAPQPAQYNVPERLFAESGTSCGLPREAIGRIISALLEITSTLNNTSLSTLLPLVKSSFKVKDIPNIHEYLATVDDLKRFIRSQPQYFTSLGTKVHRYSGFNEEVFNAVISKKALEIYPPSTAKKSSKTTLQAASGSTSGEPVDYKNVLSRTHVIESMEECKRVLEPILVKSKRETVVIGLDCEGVKLGKPKGSLTLVQISTSDGRAFLFDAFKNPQLLKGDSSLKKILEHNSILKVIHDCKSDTYSLYHGFGVTLKNVFDTSIAMRSLMEQLNRTRSYRISFKALCELLGEGASHKDDDFVKKMLETPDFWKIRPFTEEMVYYAASDALCLVPSVYLKLNGMLTPLWQDFFTWSCRDTMESIQKPQQQRSNHGNRQRASGSRTNSRRGRSTPGYGRRPQASPFVYYDDDEDVFDDFSYMNLY